MMDENRKKFVIFTHYRSGSRSLVELLRSQSLNVFDEPFNFAHCMDANDKMDRTFYKISQEKSPELAVEQLLIDYDGFKHIHLQFKKEANEYLVQNYPIIFLCRRNIVAAALSFLVAQKSRIWHAYKRNKSSEIFINNKIKNLNQIYSEMGPIDPDQLLQTASNFKKIHNYEPLMKNYIKIYYEDLYSDVWETNCQKIFNFLGHKDIEWSKVEPIVGLDNKLNNEEHFSKIENYKQITQILKPIF